MSSLDSEEYELQQHKGDAMNALNLRYTKQQLEDDARFVDQLLGRTRGTCVACLKKTVIVEDGMCSNCTHVWTDARPELLALLGTA